MSQSSLYLYQNFGPLRGPYSSSCGGLHYTIMHLRFFNYFFYHTIVIPQSGISPALCAHLQHAGLGSGKVKIGSTLPCKTQPNLAQSSECISVRMSVPDAVIFVYLKYKMSDHVFRMSSYFSLVVFILSQNRKWNSFHVLIQ